MKFIRLLSIFLTVLTLQHAVAASRQLSPEIMALLEQAIDNIYHLNTQEIQEIVQQDFGYIPEITAQELYTKMTEGEDKPLVVNVLSEKWYRDCCIADSINMPLDKLIYLVDELDRNREIVVYCALQECDASEKAYVLLRCLGFERVVDYRGGIKEWFVLGYPVQGLCAASYLHDEANRFDNSQYCTLDFDFCSIIKSRIARRAVCGMALLDID